MLIVPPRALRPRMVPCGTHVHFDTVDVEESHLQPARTRHVHIVEMRRNRRIAELGVGITADAAHVDVRIVFVIRYFDAGQNRRDIDQIGSAQRVELRLRGRYGRSRVALQRLRYTFDRDDHLRQLGRFGRLCRLFCRADARREQPGSRPRSMQQTCIQSPSSPSRKTVGLTVARRITPAMTTLSNGLWAVFYGRAVTT